MAAFRALSIMHVIVVGIPLTGAFACRRSSSGSTGVVLWLGLGGHDSLEEGSDLAHIFGSGWGRNGGWRALRSVGLAFLGGEEGQVGLYCVDGLALFDLEL